MNIKSRIYNIFNGIVDIENFNFENFKIGEKSYKNILIY